MCADTCMICTHMYTQAVFTINCWFKFRLCWRLWNNFVDRCPHPWSVNLILINLLKQINTHLSSVLWPFWLAQNKGNWVSTNFLAIMENIRPVKKLSNKAQEWCLPVVRCKWFAYGLVHATATPSSCASLKSGMVCLFDCSIPRLSCIRGH